MEFVEYLIEFMEIMEENYPKKEKHTIEEYLNVFAANPPPLEEDTTPKCPIEAEGFRKHGNQMFSRGKYEDAATKYTNSLRKSLPYSKCAALAYANRSAALYHLRAYEDCIKDIDRALDLPYPNDLREKIITRKEAAKINISNEKTETNETKNNNNHIKAIEDLKFAHGENPKLPEASRGIDIAYSRQEGRKLIATTSFQPGDLLVVEKPFLIVPELKEDPTFCYHCLKKSLCLIPCDRCSEEVYCSEECRSEAYDNYHRIECAILPTLISFCPAVQVAFSQLRCLNIVTQQGTNLNQLYDDFKEIEQSSDPVKVGFTGDQFIGNTRKALLSWLSKKEVKYDAEVLFETGYVITLLRNYTNFFKRNADVPLVANLLIKLNTVNAMNQLEIRDFGQTDTKAHGTFPLIGLARHACVNNTITYIDNNGKLILRASDHIRPGDQILHNYHDLQFSFEDTLNRTGRTLQCKRVCTKCDKTYVYPPERQLYVKMDKRLRSRMHKNPFDIEGLWKILNLVRGKHQHYTLQAQMIKTMLVDAYEGRINHVVGHAQLHMFGIL